MAIELYCTQDLPTKSAHSRFYPTNYVLESNYLSNAAFLFALGYGITPYGSSPYGIGILMASLTTNEIQGVFTLQP